MLSDAQLPRLLARLLEAEAMARGIPLSAIAVGGNLTTADGGVDGLIEWRGSARPAGWLPRRVCYFQSKAETMAKRALIHEMRPKGAGRPMFAELAKKRGAYIVFSTDDPTKSGMDDRLQAMRAALADVPNGDRIALAFYGADKIARWTNAHPGVAIWLLGELGRPLGGWRPYGGWSAAAASDTPYLFDEALRLQVGGAAMDAPAAISAIREALAKPGGTVRLIGMSGMGKTRLAEALFDARLSPRSALAQALAIYADAGRDIAISPALQAEQLASARLRAILVVDNCAEQTHSQLAEIVGKDGSQISLLTIDHDVLGERPAGLLVRIDANSEDILKALLAQRFPHLSDAERRHLAEFSGGNARIALKLAEAGGKGVDLSKLNDGELLDRLFQKGRQDLDPAARACAEAAALVHAFYAAPGDDHEAEYPVLASIAEVSDETFYRIMATFLDWGVVQQRGQQRAIMPPPLANMLAAPRIRRSDPDRLIARLSSGPDRLFASFARRLGQLHDEQAAVAIARRLFASDGRLGHPATLNPALRHGFVMAAPAAPEAALAAIERALASEERNALLQPGEARKPFSELLVHIAHEPALFGRAVAALAEFALADSDVRDDLQARKQLLERFWPILSVTLADDRTRFAALDALLAAADSRLRALGVEALDHVLDADHFNSSLNLEFGARARLTEWRPNQGLGYGAWFEAGYTRLIAIAEAGGDLADRARSIIAQHVRQHFDAGFADQMMAAMRAVRPAGFWNEGWRAICDALHFASRGPDPAPEREAALAALIALEREFRPRSLDDLFETFALDEPWGHYHPSGRQTNFTRGTGRLARAVGRVLARDPRDMGAFFDRAIATAGASNVSFFMTGLGERTTDAQALWDQAYARFAAQSGTGNPDFLVGLLRGLAGKHPDFVERQLDAAVTDPHLSPHLVTLHTAVPLGAAAMDRFCRALRVDDIPTRRFALLMNGKVSAPVPAADFARFLGELFARDGGAIVALDVLHMRMFGDRGDNVAIDPSLVALGREMITDPRLYAAEHHQHDHALAGIAGVVLKYPDAEPIARRICAAMRASAGEHYVSPYNFCDIAKCVMTRFPGVVLEEIAEQSDNDYLIERFFGELAKDDDDSSADPETGAEAILAWVAVAPEARAARMANVIRYAVKDEASGTLRWSVLAERLMTMAPDPALILRHFEHRFCSGGGWGPFSMRLVRRRPLIAAMADHADPRVRDWACDASHRLEADIARWDEADRLQDVRFE